MNPHGLWWFVHPGHRTATHVQAWNGTADHLACPECGDLVDPATDAQVGQETGTIYCPNCGHLWKRKRSTC